MGTVHHPVSDVPTWTHHTVRGLSPALTHCLMTSESFGCHDISRHRLGASARRESCCFDLTEQTDPVTLVAAGLIWMHCARVGCYWTRVEGTAGRWAFVQ